MRKIQELINKYPAHVVLVAINVIVFTLGAVLIILLGLFTKPAPDLLNIYFSLPINPIDFLLQPWGLLSHYFVHANFSHLLWNMVFLYFLGQILEMQLGKKTTYGVYMLGGFIAGLLTFLAYQIFPMLNNAGGSMVGASGAVYAIMVSIATYKPNMKVKLYGLIEIPLFVIPLFKVLSDISNFHTSNTGGHLAHLIGAGFGFLFAIQLKKGSNLLNSYFHFTDYVSDLFSKSTKSKMKVVYNNKQHISDQEYHYKQKSNEQELNAILDKVGKSGYDSLSKKEKDFLNKMSNS